MYVLTVSRNVFVRDKETIRPRHVMTFLTHILYSHMITFMTQVIDIVYSNYHFSKN